MNSVFIPLFSIYQTCQTEVKLFLCFAFSRATCTKNQEQSIAWTDNKRVHHLIRLSETINILFSSCTFKPDINSHASDLSLDAFALVTLDPFLPPRLTVRAPETLKQQSWAHLNREYFIALDLDKLRWIISMQKLLIYIKGVAGKIRVKRYIWTPEL